MDHSVLTKVIRMQATAQQQERVNAWLAESPRHRDEFEDLRLLHEPVITLPSLGGMARLKQEIHKKQDARTRRRRLAALLILLLTVIGGITVYAWRPPQPVTVRELSLAEVCNLLHKQYGIVIEVSPDLQHNQWSGSFWRPTSDQVLPMLARSIDATYTRSGNTYILSPHP